MHQINWLIFHFILDDASQSSYGTFFLTVFAKQDLCENKKKTLNEERIKVQYEQKIQVHTKYCVVI